MYVAINKEVPIILNQKHQKNTDPVKTIKLREASTELGVA